MEFSSGTKDLFHSRIEIVLTNSLTKSHNQAHRYVSVCTPLLLSTSPAANQPLHEQAMAPAAEQLVLNEGSPQAKIRSELRRGAAAFRLGVPQAVPCMCHAYSVPVQR